MVNDKVASSVAIYIPTMNKQADLNKTQNKLKLF